MKKELTFIQTKAEARAFLMFLCSERNRHLKDIADIEKTLYALRRRWRLNIPWDYEALSLIHI